MRPSHSEIKVFNLDDFLSVSDEIKEQERKFVSYILKNSSIDFTDEDQLYVITNNDFLHLVSVVVREYETLRKMFSSED